MPPASGWGSQLGTCLTPAVLCKHKHAHKDKYAAASALPQVLSPIRGSDMGIDQLNARLQALLNPPVKGKKVLETKKALWREGDRVTHLKNNTNLDVFNGDQGYIESADPGNFKLVVRYPPRAKRAGDSSSSSNQRHGQAGRDRLASLSRDVDSFREGQDDGFHRVTYVGADISETLQLSWATTVHKVRGTQAGWAGTSTDVHAASHVLASCLLPGFCCSAALQCSACTPSSNQFALPCVPPLDVGLLCRRKAASSRSCCSGCTSAWASCCDARCCTQLCLVRRSCW